MNYKYTVKQNKQLQKKKQQTNKQKQINERLSVMLPKIFTLPCETVVSRMMCGNNREISVGSRVFLLNSLG